MTTRRQVLKGSLCALCAPLIEPVASFAQFQGGRRKILIECTFGGGYDGLHFNPPKDPTLWNALAPRRPVVFGANTQLNSVTQVLGEQPLGFHPKWQFPAGFDRRNGYLKSLYDLYSEGFVALLSQVGFAGQNRSHSTAQSIWSAVREQLPAGSAAPWYQHYLERGDVQSSQIWRVDADFGLSPGGARLPVSLFSLNDLRLRFEGLLQSNLNRADSIDRALRSATSGAGVERHLRASLAEVDSMLQQSPLIQSQLTNYYPNNTFANNLRDISKIIRYQRNVRRHDGPLVFQVGLSLGGTRISFDTHSNQASHLERIIPVINEAIACLAADLREAGLWDETAILFLTEFGRRLYDNGDTGGGCEHGDANVMMLLGGGVRGSFSNGIYGPIPSAQALATAETLGGGSATNLFDFRQLYYELLRWLGLDPSIIIRDYPPDTPRLFG